MYTADYSWKNDDLWQVHVGQEDFHSFVQPYLGNGMLGVRFDKLVAGTNHHPLYTLTRGLHDGGKQLLLPAWNHLFLELGGVVYTPENGDHQLVQILDIRNGLVTLSDHWEYAPGSFVDIAIEMFVPRTFGHASYLSLRIGNITEPATLTFGLLGAGQIETLNMRFSSVDELTAIGEYSTATQGRSATQALSWAATGLLDTRLAATDADLVITAALSQGEVRFELFHALALFNETDDTRAEALRRVGDLRTLGRDALLTASAAEWQRLWGSALAFTENGIATTKVLLLHQFYLLCSLETCADPLGPLGLTKNEWGGNQLWDADFWVFRAILPLWPEYAKAIISFRARTLGKACEHASVTGYKGAWFGWQTDDEGRNITLARYNDELHINIWIALAAWEYCIATRESEFLPSTAWPLISAIADFFVSRLEYMSDGFYHLNCVLSPDESPAEGGHMRVSDSFLTNYGVIRLFAIADEAAALLGVEANPAWKTAADRIFLPVPDSYGIIPEYLRYSGHGIKQADVILAFYPLGYAASPETVRKNIGYYSDKQLRGGPAMTSQVEACILMGLGDKAEGLARLFDGMRPFVRGKHSIPFECREGENSFMLTAIGGELQALIYGYYGADLSNFDVIPRIATFMQS